ncbi:MAG TPA: hypothetical protein VEI06_02160 [Gemmatimonadaceae bacterium]|nr:hypothetical protein [Gemmatimonadaceae bacterium]
MAAKQLLSVGLLFVVTLACALFIAWRLRRLQMMRQDAETRAAAAFEEMNRLTKQLRDRKENSQPSLEAVPPGERLQQLYPGTPRRGQA